MTSLNQEQFELLYRPISGPSETLTWEFSELRDIQPNRVWSLIDPGVDGRVFAVPGYHIVNVIGYAVTERPWESDALEAIFYASPNE